jgi:hypothetical protein
MHVGDWRYSATTPDLDTSWILSGQYLATAAVHSASIEEEAGWVKSHHADERNQDCMQ